MNSASSCPICFESLSDKTKASPDNCEHIFCLTCLEKWSKLGSYCPVDRKRFKKILNLDTDTAIQVKSHKRKRKRAVYDFTTHCEVCNSSTDGNIMLLCDCCDLGYHIHCLTPPLKKIPAGLWFCPTCISVEEKLKKKNGITKEIEAEFGGFDSKSLYKTKTKEKVINEKEPMAKVKKLDNSSVTKNTSILQTCYNIISEFEDMIVRKNCSKDACSSSYLDPAIDKIDKIYKTFDLASKNSSNKHSKSFRTYSVINKKKVEAGKKSYAETIRRKTADMCHNLNGVSSDIGLQNHTLTAGTLQELLSSDAFYEKNIFSKIDKVFESPNSTINSDVNLYSESSDDPSNEFYDSSPQRKNRDTNSPNVQIFEDLNTFEDGNEMVEKNVEKIVTRKSFEKIAAAEKNMKDNAEKSRKKKQKKFSRMVRASCAEASASSSSFIKDKSSKEKLNNSCEDLDSSKLERRVVLSQISHSSEDINSKSNSYSSCSANPSASHSYYNFQSSANEKFSKKFQTKNFESISNISKYNFASENSFSDNESENSNFSDQTEIYYEEATDSYTDNEENSGTIQSENSVSSDEKEKSDCNSDENTTFCNEYVANSAAVQSKKFSEVEKIIGFNCFLAVGSDGTPYLDYSAITKAESEVKNKPSSSIRENCDEVISSNRSLSRTENSTSSNINESTVNEESTSDDEEEKNGDIESDDYEPLTDDERNVPYSEPPLSENLKSAPVKNDLQLIYFNPDLTFSIAKPSVEMKESDSHSNRNIMNSPPLSEYDQCVVSSESQPTSLCEITENENFTEEEENSLDDLDFENFASQINNDLSDNIILPQHEQSQFSNEAASSSYVIGHEKITNEPQSVSDKDYSSDIQITNAQPTSLCEITENENFTEEEENSLDDLDFENFASQINNDLSDNIILPQHEQSQFSNEAASSSYVTGHEKITDEPQSVSDKDYSSDIQITNAQPTSLCEITENENFTEEEENSLDDLDFENFASQINNDLSDNFIILPQHKQSQSSNEAASSTYVTGHEKITDEPQSISDKDYSSDIQIINILNESDSNFKSVSQNEQFYNFKPVSEDIPAVNTSHVQKPITSSTNKNYIHYEGSTYFVQNEDGLYLADTPNIEN